jgi:hypothetical protein
MRDAQAGFGKRGVALIRRDRRKAPVDGGDSRVSEGVVSAVRILFIDIFYAISLIVKRRLSFGRPTGTRGRNQRS